MEDKKSFGEYVSKRRKEIGLTQKEFAEKLFVTESAVSKWERGISYPDITLIRDMCDILLVSEHELLTASVDIEARQAQKFAKRYINMVNGYKNTLIGIYGISLLVCFICNIAIFQTLSWFFIVLTAEMVAMSITLVPIMLPKRRGLATLGSFLVTLLMLLLTCTIYTGGDWFLIASVSILLGLSLIFLPYVLNSLWLPTYLADKKTLLYFSINTILLILTLYICNLYVNGQWFYTIAMPITMYTLLLPWGMMFFIRYAKLNGYLKASGCFALASIFEFNVQGMISMILKDGQYGFGIQYNFTEWNEMTVSGNINMILFSVLIGLTLVFGILGIIKSIKMNQVNN